jgi:uncharacterized protein with HEPN domain
VRRDLYFGLNLDEVWAAVERDVPQLRQQVQVIVEAERSRT